MKRLSSIIIIAIIALVSMNATAQSSTAEDCAIPYEELVNMIVTSAHWSENNLSEMGLTKIGSMSYEEEFGECSIFAYGKNVKGEITEDWQVELSADGAHAYAIVVQLTTDIFKQEYARSVLRQNMLLGVMRWQQSCIKGI